MRSDITRVEMPPRPFYVGPSLDYVGSLARGFGMQEDRWLKMREAARAGLQGILERSTDAEPIGLEVFEEEGHLVVEVENRGAPVFLDGQLAPLELDRVQLENRGRGGQTLHLAMRLGGEAVRRGIVESGAVARQDAEATPVLRELRADETGELSRLFYSVYRYDYINEFVYYPEKVRAMIEEGKLISLAAVLPSGRLAGHVGLLKWSDKPAVYEPCLGVVDPALKSKGLFGKLFEKSMERIDSLPMQYCFFDFVTNHELSQKFVARYHPVDLALFVGCQSKETQAKLERLGIGEDPKETDRYTLLYSILPKVKQPFGKELQLPANLGEMLGFLLEPLDLQWRPTPRFEVLAEGGDFAVHLQPQQSAVIFDLHQPGRAAVDRIHSQWRELRRGGFQYCAVEVAVGQPGIANLYDLLAEQGFFVAGFVPCRHTYRLALRFQAMGPTKVSFDEIRVFTPTAKRLLECVRNNFERNALL